MLAFGILKAKRGLIDLNMFAEFADVVDIKGLCKMLNIGKNKAYELLNLGKIKTFRIGKTYKIPKSSIIDYIKESTK